MTIKANRIERYYDTHDLEGAELTSSRIHVAIIEYLTAVIQWIFNGQDVGVTGGINFYMTDNGHEPSKSPDIVIVDGLEVDPDNLEDKPSYYIGQDGPPPRVVFEISSRETWRQDLEEKPARYAAMGITEYFVFDPNTRTLWAGQWRKYNRLIGWRKDPLSGEYVMLEKDEAGRLWSDELASWLVVEGNKLRLYTVDGQLRLTEAEAEKRNAALERLRADAERQRAQAALQEAAAKDRVAEMERQRAEAALKQTEELKERLRKMGLDPDEIA